MKLELNKKPKGVKIIEGFPGFGLIGTITTEFLIDHLKCEFIGNIWIKELPAMVAIHKGEVVNPLGIFYNKDHNLIILHAITSPRGLEWDLSDALIQIAKELEAKEIISIEGVGSPRISEEPNSYFYSNNESNIKKLKGIGLKPLKEGIIMGVTSTLLLKIKKTRFSCLFVETHSALPDSKASAEVVKALDKYLGLNVDYKPLLKTAEQFEAQLKELMSNTQQAVKERDKRQMSYVG